MKIEWKTCLKIGVSAFLLYLCILYWGAFSGLLGALLGAAAPLAIGGAIAYLINILMSLYERYCFPRAKKKWLQKSRRPICMVGAMLTLLAVIALVIGLVVPQFVSCVKLLFMQMQGAVQKLLPLLDQWNLVSDDLLAQLKNLDWQSLLERVFKMLTSGIGSAMDIVISTVSSVFSFVVTAFLSVIFSIYLLLDKEKLAGQGDRVLRKYAPKKLYDRVRYVLSILHDCFRRYIVGQCTEAVILGMLCTIGMLILRLPYATMIGAFIAVTALIPVAGAYIGGVVGAFMIFTVSPVKAVIFLVFLVALQQIEGNVIYPRVVGSSMGLPAIWVLAAVTVGGGVGGVGGMIVSVPLAATLYRILRNDLHKKDGISPAQAEEPKQKSAQKNKKKEQPAK